MSTTQLAANPLAVLVFDSQTQTSTPNPAWTKLFGPSSNGYAACFHADDRTTVEGLVALPGSSAEVRSAGPWPLRVALQSTQQDGQTQLWAIPLGRPALEPLPGQDLALSEMLMRFLSLVSHEFRTPLTVILSSAEILEHYGANWPAAKRQIHFLRMQTAAATMTNLLDNIAFLAQAESTRSESIPALVALRPLITAVIEELKPLCELGQTIQVHLHPTNAAAHLDGHILKAVVSNLLSNALHVSPAHTTVTITMRLQPQSLEVTVDDHTENRIPTAAPQPNQQPRLPSSGLGLAILHRCMDLVGGTANHQPHPDGQGTRAIVHFPIAST